MTTPIGISREALIKIFPDFETMRQFELLLDTVDEISNTTLSTLQDEVDLKAPLASPAFTGTASFDGISITGTVTGIDKTDVGLGNVDNTSDASKPVSTATQTQLDLKAPIASPTFTGTVSGITKAMVGLGNVDNTSDANKPVSTAQQTALDLKAPLASPSFTGTAKTEGDTFGIDTSKTPASASDTGTTGQIAWDSSYLYVCTATDTWKRVAIATW